MAISFSSVQLDRFRREAKKLGSELSIPHSEALDRIAVKNGFTNWSLLRKHSNDAAPPLASQSPAMTATEYNGIRVRSGISVSDNWLGITGLKTEQDVAFSRGTSSIPDNVASKLTVLMRTFEETGRELHVAIQSALKTSVVTFDDHSLSLDIIFPSGQSIRVHNAGIDTANYWRVYKTKTPSTSQDAALFLRVQRAQGGNWYLWRGDFAESRHMRRLQSSANPIESAILKEVFRRFL